MRIVTGSHRAGVDSLVGDEVKVRVSSPPVAGRANAELCEVLADAFGLRPRQVTLVAGHTARSKRVRLELPSDAVTDRLSALLNR